MLLLQKTICLRPNDALMLFKVFKLNLKHNLRGSSVPAFSLTLLSRQRRQSKRKVHFAAATLLYPLSAPDSLSTLLVAYCFFAACSLLFLFNKKQQQQHSQDNVPVHWVEEKEKERMRAKEAAAAAAAALLEAIERKCWQVAKSLRKMGREMALLSLTNYDNGQD